MNSKVDPAKVDGEVKQKVKFYGQQASDTMLRPEQVSLKTTPSLHRALSTNGIEKCGDYKVEVIVRNGPFFLMIHHRVHRQTEF